MFRANGYLFTIKLCQLTIMPNSSSKCRHQALINHVLSFGVLVSTFVCGKFSTSHKDIPLLISTEPDSTVSTPLDAPSA